MTETGHVKAGHRLSGRSDGLEIVLFQYKYKDVYQTVDDRRSTWAGQQTVFLLPAGCELPDFYFAPRELDWERLIDARLWMTALGSVVLEVPLGDDQLALLRGRKRRALDHLSDVLQRRVNDLLAGWTIECCRGGLLFYRDNQVIGPHELGRYLHQVTCMAGALREAAAGLAPPQPECDSTDPRVRPDFNEPT